MSTQIENFAIIPHANLPAILMLETEAGWSLPQHQADEIPDIIQTFKDHWQLTVTILYLAYDRYEGDEEHEGTHRIYALENHSPAWVPPATGRWITQSELSTLLIIEADHRAIIELWFSELDTSTISKQRHAWLYPGWFSAASNWIEQQLQQVDYQKIGEIEQVHTTDWSCVLRIRTIHGDLYFKASDPMIVDEPLFTQALAKISPTQLPQILAMDKERGWMIMHDVGTPLADRNDLKKELSIWESLLSQFAQLQITAATQLEDLLISGSDRRLERLPKLFAEAFTNTPMLMVGQKGGITTEEFARLAAIQPELETLCTELASYNIPETIHHDDLHGGNIALHAKEDHRFIFFDWAESSLAHPFYTMVVVMRVARYICQFDQEQQGRMRDAYLQPWTQYEQLERLQTAFKLAQRLGKLCRALTWYTIIQSTEPRFRTRYAGTWPYWLQLFLGTQE